MKADGWGCTVIAFFDQCALEDAIDSRTARIKRVKVNIHAIDWQLSWVARVPPSLTFAAVNPIQTLKAVPRAIPYPL
jgi:hypothetical protein